jgi:hypothetical protein
MPSFSGHTCEGLSIECPVGSPHSESQSTFITVDHVLGLSSPWKCSKPHHYQGDPVRIGESLPSAAGRPASPQERSPIAPRLLGNAVHLSGLGLDPL